MATPGEVLDAPSLGVQIEFRTTTAESGGELLEFDVVGRPRGFITTPHIHPAQRERHEVIEGSMRIEHDGFESTLVPGDVIETRPGNVHMHRPAGDAPGRIRVRLRPALRTEEWLERIVEMDRDGEFLRGGWPRPVAGARLILDFDGEAHAASSPPRVQRAIARAILRAHALAAQRRR